MTELDTVTKKPTITSAHSPFNPQSIQTSEAIDLEDRFGTHNYHPLPVVLKKDEAAGYGM